METPTTTHIPEADVKRAMKIAWALVRYYARLTGLPAEQLEDFAADGLLRACAKYDGTRGIPFFRFARLHIRYAILEGLRPKSKQYVWNTRRLRGRMRHVRLAPVVPERPDKTTEYRHLVHACQDTMRQQGTPRQRQLLDAILEGHHSASVVLEWGVTASAVSQKLKEVRAILRPVFAEWAGR